MRRVLLAIVLMCSIPAMAQVTIGGGVDMGWPLMFNGFVQGHNHASVVAGARLAVQYAPKDGVFSAALIGGVSPMILPVVRFNNGQDVLYMNFLNTGITLLGRFRKQLENRRELHYGVGVGANMLKGNQVQISKRSENEISRIIEDSSFYNKATLPSFYLNAEYILPLNSQTKRVFCGLGAQLHYIYFLDQGLKYRVDLIDKNLQYFSLQPELKGHMLNPMIYFNVYYKL